MHDREPLPVRDLRAARHGGKHLGDRESSPAPRGRREAQARATVPARLTELEEVTFEADRAELTAAAATSLPITFAYPSTALPPPIRSNVLWTVPPRIPGRPDLTFETSEVNGDRTSLLALLEVPTDVKGRSGLLQLNPWPTEAGSPPYSFNVTPEPETGRLDATIGNSVSLRGRVRDAAGNPFPMGTFMAQAFRGESLVSNSCTVDAEGRFALLIPATVATDAVQLALIPRNGNTDPAFLSKGQDVALPVTTLDVMLPSYVPVPRYFKLRLTDSAGDPVDPGMLVRARAVLRADENGTTVFGQNAVSLADGTATLALLPGTQSVKLRYSFVVSPGVTSTFTTYCSGAADAVEVSAGSTDRNNPTALPIVSLVSRFRVSGTVFKHNGSAVTHDGRVANVVVTATLLEPAHPDCPPASRR